MTFRIEINGEYGDPDGSIHLMDDDTELVMWDSAEWLEDPSLVFVIANAIRIGYTYGPAAVRATIDGQVVPEDDQAAIIITRGQLAAMTGRVLDPEGPGMTTVRLINEIRLPNEEAIRTWVTRLTVNDEDGGDPDDFSYDGVMAWTDSFALGANYWIDHASRAGLFGEGNLTLWPVMDGDYQVGGFILTIDVGHSPQLRLATLHQDQDDVIGDRSVTGRKLIVSLLTKVTQLAAVEVSTLLYRAGQPSVEAVIASSIADKYGAYSEWDDTEIEDHVLGSGATSYPWWKALTRQPDGTFHARLESPDRPEETASTTFTVDDVRRVRGEILAGGHGVNDTIRDALRDDPDADAIDCLLQVLVLGEVTYG